MTQPGTAPVIASPTHLGNTHEDLRTRAQDATPAAVQWILAVALTLALLLIASRHLSHSEFFYNDEPQHAASGLFYADFMRDLPLLHARHYAEVYYARYPTLSGLVHWPPLFYLFEGGVFLVSRTATAARLLVLAFAAVALLSWFSLVRYWTEWKTALVGCAFLGLMPFMVRFERFLMLEVPSLALALLAIYLWVRYLDSGRARYAYLFGCAAAAALLTKQNCIFLAPFCALSALALHQGRRLCDKNALKIGAIVVALAGPYYALVFATHWRTMYMDIAGQADKVQSGAFAVFVRTLPDQAGWPLLIVAAVGFPLSFFLTLRRPVRILICWAAACFLTMAVFGHKEPRYVFTWLPVFSFFAAVPFTWLRARLNGALWASAVAAVVLLVGMAGWRSEKDYLRGYQAAASVITGRTQSAIVMLDDTMAPGTFIFYLRTLAPQGNFVVLRKGLYAVQGTKRGGSVELTHSTSEISRVLDTNGVRYVVTLDGFYYQFQAQEELRTLLASNPQYKLLARIAMETNQESSKSAWLSIYENTSAHPPTTPNLTVKMLTLGHDIVVPWSELGFAYDSARSGQ